MANHIDASSLVRRLREAERPQQPSDSFTCALIKSAADEIVRLQDEQRGMVREVLRLMHLEADVADLKNQVEARDGEVKRLIEDLKQARQGLFRCGLCGQYDHPVNHHNDCAGCARAQYGD